MARPPVPTLSPYTEQLPDVNSPATWATRTPLFWNWVTGAGYTNMEESVTYIEGSMTYIDEALDNVDDALISVDAAVVALEDFDKRYLGPKATAPTLDNQGAALQAGAFYFNTTSNGMFVRTSTGAWQAVAPLQLSSTQSIELGRDLTGDRNCFVDLHSYGTAAQFDFSARILRAPGLNGKFIFSQTGSGPFEMQGDFSVTGTLVGGYTTANDDDGTISSGTYTPVVSQGNFKRIFNNGAFTLAAPNPSTDYSLVLRVQNAAGAGAITFSGFTKVAGDVYNTGNGQVYMLFITKVHTSILLNIVRM